MPRSTARITMMGELGGKAVRSVSANVAAHAALHTHGRLEAACHFLLIGRNVEFQALWLPILLYAALGRRPLAPQLSSQVSVAHSDQVAPHAFSAVRAHNRIHGLQR